jgi:hypothetical protein
MFDPDLPGAGVGASLAAFSGGAAEAGEAAANDRTATAVNEVPMRMTSPPVQ